MRIILLLLLSLPAFALAAPAPQPQTSCPVTPSVKTITHYPGRAHVVTSNNLVLPAGKSVYADGQRLFISGRVLDKNCVPVSDAIVEIWQVNTDGQYVTATLSDRMSPYPYFTGSGRAVTDNLGQFTFVTVFPGTENDRTAPHINFHVTQNSFHEIYTKMFFTDDRRNADDGFLATVSSQKQDLLMGKVSRLDDPKDAIGVEWNIVLDGVNTFRKF